MCAMLLLLHTHFEPFVPVTKNRNPLHHGDFFALVTAFLTLTAGIYLFQNVGNNIGFQTFLTVVVIGINVSYVSVTCYWYVALRLVDMENNLVEADENQACNAWLVMHLQRCLPDWRAKANLEEIEETNRIERNLVHNVDVERVLRVKHIAQRWRMKSKTHAFESEARKLEEQFAGNQLKLVQKLERLRRQSQLQIQDRIKKRKLLRSQINAQTEGAEISLSKAGRGGNGSGNGGGDANIGIGQSGGDSSANGPTIVMSAVGAKAAELAKIEKAKMAMPSFTLVKGLKLTTIGFQLKPDYKGRVAVRSIDRESKAYENGIRDGYVLRYVGDFDTQLESLNAVVRLVKTQPRPIVLRFEHLSGGVAAVQEGEREEDEDPDMI